jgi:hypothetical protein
MICIFYSCKRVKAELKLNIEYNVFLNIKMIFKECRKTCFVSLFIQSFWANVKTRSTCSRQNFILSSLYSKLDWIDVVIMLGNEKLSLLEKTPLIPFPWNSMQQVYPYRKLVSNIKWSSPRIETSCIEKSSTTS